MRARAEYRGFEYLLNGLPQMIPPLAETSAPHPTDIASATATLHKAQCVPYPRTCHATKGDLNKRTGLERECSCRENSTRLSAALTAVARKDISHQLLSKALKEGQIAVLKTQIAQGDASVTGQVRLSHKRVPQCRCGGCERDVFVNPTLCRWHAHFTLWFLQVTR